MSEALTTTSPGSYHAMRAKQEDADYAMSLLRGTRLIDLERITIPAGGGDFWTVPTIQGPQAEKALKGIILAWHDARVYWSTGLEDGGGKPPDCGSEDLERGFGLRPGIDDGDQPEFHVCAECPLSRFGSDGRGQACSQRMMILFLMPQSLIPVLIQVPPSSLQAINNYLRILAGQSTRAWQVETELTLEKSKNADNIGYAKAKARSLRMLSKEEVEVAARLCEQLKRTFRLS